MNNTDIYYKKKRIEIYNLYKSDYLNYVTQQNILNAVQIFIRVLTVSKKILDESWLSDSERIQDVLFPIYEIFENNNVNEE